MSKVMFYVYKLVIIKLGGKFGNCKTPIVNSNFAAKLVIVKLEVAWTQYGKCYKKTDDCQFSLSIEFVITAALWVRVRAWVEVLGIPTMWVCPGIPILHKILHFSRVWVAQGKVALALKLIWIKKSGADFCAHIPVCKGMFWRYFTLLCNIQLKRKRQLIHQITFDKIFVILSENIEWATLSDAH